MKIPSPIKKKECLFISVSRQSVTCTIHEILECHIMAFLQCNAIQNCDQLILLVKKC